ncbi:MAG: hypothetical protein ACE5L7_03895 [Candidatus Aminicenantales bacterium]
MRRKILIILGIAFLVFIVQTCQQKPEEGLLKRYFHALSLNDLTTMSTMALEPVSLDVKDWDIVSVSEEIIEPASLPDLNKKELELKKKLEDHVGVTLDARDALDEAKFELDNARTRAAKRAAQKKVDELQAKYDEIYTEHKELQRQYNEAKAASAREEEITLFSLGAGELPNVRDFTGDVHSKEVDVKIVGKEGEGRTYRFYLRRYNLRDEAMGLNRRGRWIIVKFEPLG